MIVGSVGRFIEAFAALVLRPHKSYSASRKGLDGRRDPAACIVTKENNVKLIF